MFIPPVNMVMTGGWFIIVLLPLPAGWWYTYPSEKFLSEFVSWENHGNSQLNGNSLPTYPLVNCHITMENHNFSWEISLQMDTNGDFPSLC